MINIELSDIENLSPEALRATGRYLIAMADSGDFIVEKKPVTPPPVPVCKPESPEPLERAASEVFKKPAPAAVTPPPAPAPVTPPPAPAPVTPPPAPASVELDSEGLPWDSRIHSRTKSKTKDGRWKKIRGVGAEIVKRVEDELKQVQNIPVAPAPASSGSSETAPTFADLMSLVTRSITNGKLTREQVIEVLKPFEIPSLPLLATRLDLIPAVIQAFNEVIDAA